MTEMTTDLRQPPSENPLLHGMVYVLDDGSVVGGRGGGEEERQGPEIDSSDRSRDLTSHQIPSYLRSLLGLRYVGSKYGGAGFPKSTV